MDTRQKLLVAGFIAVVILIAWALYSLIFSTFTTGPTGPGNNNQSGNLPNVNQGNIPVVNGNIGTPVFPFPDGGEQLDDVAAGGQTKVTDYAPIVGQQVEAAENGLVFYNSNKSIFEALGYDGDLQPFGSEKFYNVSNVTWAQDRSIAILEYPDGSNILYDFNRSRQVSLPKELESFALDGDGSSYSAIWDGGKPDATWLMVGSADGSDLKIVEPIGDEKNNVEVGVSPDKQVVAFYSKASGFDEQRVLPIGRNQEQYDSFTVDGLKFESKWSPEGSYLLFNTSSGTDGYRPRLYLTEGRAGDLGYSQTNLQLNTWADKCTFDGSATSVYCAVPIDLPDGAGLYPGLADRVPDVFYRIDLVSGNKIPLAIPVGAQAAYTAKSLFLSPDESVLYFVDGPTGRLHSIRLK